MPRLMPTFVADGEERHGDEFADREEGDERERIHSGEVRLAIRDVHRSPENSRTQSGENAERRSARSGLMRRCDGQQGCAAEHARGTA